MRESTYTFALSTHFRLQPCLFDCNMISLLNILNLRAFSPRRMRAIWWEGIWHADGFYQPPSWPPMSSTNRSVLPSNNKKATPVFSVSWEHGVLDENRPQWLVPGLARPLHHRPQHLLPSQSYHDPQVAWRATKGHFSNSSNQPQVKTAWYRLSSPCTHKGFDQAGFV